LQELQILRIYIDSADLVEIREALVSGYVHGVTTNPTLLRRAGVRADAVPDLAQQVLAYGARELHLQTYAEDVQGIIRDGAALAGLDPARVVVKVPATAQGFAAASQLSSRGLRVTLTAVYTVRQAILAHAVGAHYIAVYVGRMRDRGLDAAQLVAQMQKVLDVQRSSVEILAASVRAPEEIETLAEAGVATVTLPLKVLRQLPESPATSAAAATFLEDSQVLR
ncbi:MAG: transaldolase, partial [Chloroflexota bacterium]|nr:transaldolase [Chloroflexota bacterium]